MARRGAAREASGGALLAAVSRKIERDGWPPGLTVLSGVDAYHRDRAQALLLAALLPAADREFGLTVFGETKVELSTVLGAARSVGMFSPVRVVTVRDASALDGNAEALLAYAEAPPSGSYLLIRADKLDRRRKLDQALAKAGTFLEFPEPGEPERLGPEVVALAAEKDLALAAEAGRMLALACAGDFYRIDGELEKLRALAGGAARVGLAEVREIVSSSGVLSGWELADAVGAGDRSGALRALRRLLDAGAEPLALLGGLAFRARGLLQAKTLMARGTPAQIAVKQARLFGRPFRETIAGLERYEVGDLLAFPGALLRADRTLKSSSLPPAAVLETLIREMTPTPRRGREARR